MINEDFISGYSTGHDEGYSGSPARMFLGERNSSFVTGYLKGYADGEAFREIIYSCLKQIYAREDLEMQRVINKRKIKF
jgi:hypothetical protein